jgi:RNA polymerase sigma-70 factor (family 1)
LNVRGGHDEKQLLLQVSGGDEKAFAILFNTYRPKLYSYIIKITGSEEAAEDCVHDVFLKIWLQKEKLTDIQNLNAYLHRMAHNHALNGLRRMTKQALAIAELEKEKPTENTTPEETAARKEVLQFINDAVNKLTPQQKQVFKLSREAGLKQDEIAAQLGISVLTVKRHLTDALNFLRKEVSKSYGSQAVCLWVVFRLVH